MPKLNIPNSAIIVGATLYIDLVQKDYLERIYPYLKLVKRVDRFSTFKPEIVDDALSIIKYSESLIIFVHDRFYKKLVQEFVDRGFKKEGKDGASMFTIDEKKVILKSISLFNKIESSVFNANRNVANFKIFGDEDSLTKIEDAICMHAVITKVLPTWYNISVLDNEGEKTLIEMAEEKKVKLMPIASVRDSLVKYLSSKGKTISFAESCTGGLLAYKFISKSGASNVIKGSMVTYANEIKESWLGVKEDTLNKYGAVSKECVSQMLDGIKDKTNSDIAIAISGIAGPTGESAEKEVGTIYIGILNEKSRKIVKYNFLGDRNFIQEQAARTAIEMLIYSESDFFEFF